MTGAADFQAAAALTALGLPGWRLIVSDDPAEVLALHVLAVETRRVVEAHDEALAVRIANAVGRLFKK